MMQSVRRALSHEIVEWRANHKISGCEVGAAARRSFCRGHHPTRQNKK